MLATWYIVHSRRSTPGPGAGVIYVKGLIQSTACPGFDSAGVTLVDGHQNSPWQVSLVPSGRVDATTAEAATKATE